MEAGTLSCSLLLSGAWKVSAQETLNKLAAKTLPFFLSHSPLFPVSTVSVLLTSSGLRPDQVTRLPGSWNTPGLQNSFCPSPVRK